MESHYGGVKTRQQMADEYRVCRKTFNKLLHEKHIILQRGLICPKDQLNIYTKLGNPNSIGIFPNIPRSSQ